MEYRSLGRTGMQVSKLCLGCMMFGWRNTEEESYDIVDRAIDAGINFMDTANMYRKGGSEETLGKALKRNGKRDQVVVATKVHVRMDNGEDPNMQGNSRRHIVQQCEASLKRLQTDWIDLYQIHRPQSDIPIDETLRALDDLVRSGMVRYIGTSTFAAWQVMEAHWVAREYGTHRFVSEQPPYNLLDRRIERELIPMAQSYGMGIIPWSPLAAGLLTGKYTRENHTPADARYTDLKHNANHQKRLNDAVWDAVEGLAPLVEAKGVTFAQYALAWAAQMPGITSPIIGPRTVDQLEDNLGAAEITLNEAELARIDEIVPPGTFAASFYEADFGPHQHRW